MIGETLGNYRIVAKIGEGGMGAVYKAEHALIGRKGAVKVLLPQFSQNQEIVNRFFNEARSTSMVAHAGLVDVFDFGYAADGSAYLVMEFLEGESLASRIKRDHRLPYDLVSSIGRQVASALGAAHDKGIVHRDLKPDNIFLVPDREIAGGLRVKVLDFGIAKLTEDKSAASMTRTGAVMGTPMYMSPEQCRGAGQVDHRSDIYALGCILFEMVCGQTPFGGQGVGEIIAAHIYEAPPSPSLIDPQLPAVLASVISRSLMKKPEDRPQKMQEIEESMSGPIGRASSQPMATVMAPNTGGYVAMKTPAPITGAGVTGPGMPGPTVVPQVRPQTTLGSAAAEMQGHATGAGMTTGVETAGGKGKWALIGAVAVAVIAGGAFFATRGGGKTAAAHGDGTPPAISATPPRSTDPTPPPTTNTDPGTGGTAAAGGGTPATPPAPKKVQWTIESDPPGADVYRAADSILVGSTPYHVEADAATGMAVFLIKQTGFKDEKVKLAADHDDDAKVKLVKLPGYSSSGHGGGGGGGKTGGAGAQTGTGATGTGTGTGTGAATGTGATGGGTPATKDGALDPFGGK